MKKIFFACMICSALSGAPAMAALPENSREILNHLEFLGYKTETTGDSIIGRHASNPTILIRGTKSGLQVGAIYRGAALGREERYRLLEIVNEMNGNSIGIKFHIDTANNLIGEGYFPGVYEKVSFGSNLEHFNGGIRYHLSQMRDRIMPLLQPGRSGKSGSEEI